MFACFLVPWWIFFLPAIVRAKIVTASRRKNVQQKQINCGKIYDFDR
jgi:hypothetical protein